MKELITIARSQATDGRPIVNNKVTSEALRKMEIGQTITFELPDADAINSGKAIAYRLQNSLRCKFRALSDYANNRLTITKHALYI